MAYQVKRSITRIVTIIIGFLGYGGYILMQTNSELFELKDFGLYILLIVPILIILEIIGKIILDIFNQTQKKKEQPKSMDEFDRLIEYKSVRNFAFVFLFGFFLSCFFMFILGTIYIPFIIMFIIFYLSGIALQVSYILYYNHGV